MFLTMEEALTSEDSILYIKKKKKKDQTKVMDSWRRWKNNVIGLIVWKELENDCFT